LILTALAEPKIPYFPLSPSGKTLKTLTPSHALVLHHRPASTEELEVEIRQVIESHFPGERLTPETLDSIRQAFLEVLASAQLQVEKSEGGPLIHGA
jgi:hypothetical protein